MPASPQKRRHLNTTIFCIIRKTDQRPHSSEGHRDPIRGASIDIVSAWHLGNGSMSRRCNGDWRWLVTPYWLRHKFGTMGTEMDNFIAVRGYERFEDDEKVVRFHSKSTQQEREGSRRDFDEKEAQAHMFVAECPIHHQFHRRINGVGFPSQCSHLLSPTTECT
jgi:hypothetical protein